MKLDLEGEEFPALRGAEKTLRAQRSCCVFENGLGGSANDYSAEEFFGYFRDLDYDLYDVLGCRVDETRWSRPGPWNFVAMPRADCHQLLPLLWASALEGLLASHWSPVPLAPVPPSFHDRVLGPSDVVGYVDHVETFVRVSGWAGNRHSGRPTKSLVITSNGVPLGTLSPTILRNDVVVATGLGGLANSGFECVVPGITADRIEIHAESDNGTFSKLSGTDS
jgi:hypothetical protein